MKHSKKSVPLFVLVMLIIALPAVAQNSAKVNVKSTEEPASKALACNTQPVVLQQLFYFDAQLKLSQAKREQMKLQRASEVRQDNEYVSTGKEKGIFLANPLRLNGLPLDYGEFDTRSQGVLTVSKGGAIPDDITPVAFYVYLRRNGKKVIIPGQQRLDAGQMKVEISAILEHAEPGDQLVIEAVNAEDGAVKRILKLLGPGC